MAIEMVRKGVINYPLVRAEVMVIGSDDSRITEACHHILDNELKVKGYFFSKIKGLIESLAHNQEKDRTHHLSSLKKTLNKKVKEVIIFAHVNCPGDPQCTNFLAKKQRRVDTAWAARNMIKGLFCAKDPELKISCYLITINGEEKYWDQIIETKDQTMTAN